MFRAPRWGQTRAWGHARVRNFELRSFDWQPAHEFTPHTSSFHLRCTLRGIMIECSLLGFSLFAPKFCYTAAFVGTRELLGLGTRLMRSHLFFLCTPPVVCSNYLALIIVIDDRSSILGWRRCSKERCAMVCSEVGDSVLLDVPLLHILCTLSVSFANKKGTRTQLTEIWVVTLDDKISWLLSYHC